MVWLLGVGITFDLFFFKKKKGFCNSKRKSERVEIIGIGKNSLLTFILQRLNIQHSNLYPSLSQQLHNGSTDAIAPARDNNDFLAPIILFAHSPVIQNPTIQKLSDALKQPQNESQAESLEKGWMRSCSLATFVCVSREQEPWEG